MDRRNHSRSGKRKPLEGRVGAAIYVIVFLAGFVAGAPAFGATLNWTGAGNIFWDDGLNWDLGRGPLNGDNLVFQGFTNRTIFDNYLSLTLGSIGFATNTGQFNIHIQGDLFLNGAGVVNNTSFDLTGVLYQEIFVDGDAQARLILQNSATIFGVGGIARTDLTARAGTIGGTIIFEGNSSVSTNNTSNFLFAQGASAPGSVAGQVIFRDNAVGSCAIENQAGTGGQGGRTYFRGNAVSAGRITSDGGTTMVPGAEGVAQLFDNTQLNSGVNNYGGTVAGARGGRLELHDHATATLGLIFNIGAQVDGAEGGRTQFFDFSSAGHLIIEDDPGGLGGVTEFFGDSTAATSTIENLGNGPGLLPGRTYFRDNSRAADATLIAFDSIDGNGGAFYFEGNASGGNARVRLTGNGTVFDISALTSTGTTFGSIEGEGGAIFLGNKMLTVGGNNASTTFAGVISDGGQAAGASGSITKAGAGTLTLTGASTYTGTTTVSGGALFVDGSMQGTNVNVGSGATLGGGGTINGAVTISNGGTLAPGSEMMPGTLTINGTLSLNSASILNFRLGAPGVVGGPSNDLNSISGNLTLAGILNVADSGGFTIGSYRLINYGGTLTNNGLTIGTVPAGFTTADFVVQTGVARQINLIVGSTTVLFWDGAQTSSNGVIDGGSGNWNNSTTNWTNAIGNYNSPWTGQFSIFSGSAGVVTLSENVVTTGMQFLTEGYTVGANAGAAFTLVGSAFFRVDPGLHATISAPLAGGGSLTKMDRGTLTLAGANTYSGGTMVADGVLIVQSVGGLGTGNVTVLGTPTSELRFVNSASAGGVNITNVGAAGPYVGVTSFYDNASAGTATITNAANTATGGEGGYLAFYQNSNAGSANIFNVAGLFNNPAGLLSAGQTNFYGNSSAANASLTNLGVLNASGTSGFTYFLDSSTAGTSLILNLPSAIGRQSGFTGFYGSATAGNATIINRSADLVGAVGGGTLFFNSSNAGTANVSVSGAAVAGSGPASVEFSDAATAGGATIDAEGGRASDGISSAGVPGGLVMFASNSTAGNATLTAHGATVDGAAGGSISFYGNSNAGSATFTNEATAAAGPLGSSGGSTVFHDASNANNATFSNVGAGLDAAPGAADTLAPGRVTFLNTSMAGSATFRNRGSTGANGIGGNVNFYDSSSADNATFTNEGGTVFRSFGGKVNFFSGSNAGAASFTNRATTVAGAAGGSVEFSAASASNASFFNEGASGLFSVGAVFFNTDSTAANSTITNGGGTAPGAPGGQTIFLDNATGGNAVIHNRSGSGDGAGSGQTVFYGNSTAGAATLYAESAPLATAAGGSIIFNGNSDGGTARAIIEGVNGALAGGLDLSLLTATTMQIGSIEGGGIVSLGSRNLHVGTNNLSTTFSGLIRDGGFNPATGGSLTKVGTGALTLSGANTYTGGTMIDLGKLIANNATGSATGTGSVTINAGGTLGGSGFIAGAVILNPGGTIAPGDPTTLHLQSDLLWNGGGMIRLVLGPNQAGSDLVEIRGDLTRGSDGSFQFFIIDGGIVAGQPYDLIHFGSLSGFTASDFSALGYNGSLFIDANGLEFTAAVPEPSTMALCGIGIVLLVFARARVRIGAPAACDGHTIKQMEKEFFEKVRPALLFKRFPTRDRVSATVAFICGPLASATNGAAVRVDGGVVKSAFYLWAIPSRRSRHWQKVSR